MNENEQQVKFLQSTLRSQRPNLAQQYTQLNFQYSLNKIIFFGKKKFNNPEKNIKI
jgi:protein tyrosine phosphatase